MSPQLINERKEARLGVSAALMAFLFWGASPIYWNFLSEYAYGVILAHRILWSSALLALLITLQNRWAETFLALQTMKSALTLTVTSILIGGNWLLYIAAVNQGNVIEASLGYFICPIMNVLLGVVVLKEKLYFAKLLAIGLVVIGVGYAVLGIGEIPWIALTLALSFSIYALLRKTVQVEAMPGLALESFILMIPAAAYLVFFAGGMTGDVDGSFNHYLILAGSGVITTVPLLLYTFGARRIQLSTLGLLQYIAPTIMFSLGIFMFGDVFTRDDLIMFGFIWAGILVYIFDTFNLADKFRNPGKLAQTS